MEMIQQLELSTFGRVGSAPDRCAGLIVLMESVPGLNEGAGPWQGHFPLGTAKADVTGRFILLSLSFILLGAG